MEVRAMTESDRQEVHRILCACYRLLGRIEGLPPEAVAFLLSERASLESLRRESAYQTFLVAEVEQRIAGVVAIDGSRVAKLYVDPPYHRRGIGAALFRAAETAIRECGYDHLTLGSAPSAVGFYQAMGASVTGRKPPVPGPLANHQPFLMRKPLVPM